ncbi:hypothetical protein EMIHUDRAFT_454433 [Emiliania huxleyi CCMP1516]|uniref:Cation/H+ exchanger domain-containing protein n=2 Tax=Emiliania huxleyi TaxID=2903 RepID=A0A0D3KUC5_EMIH1|nr:hypothetical protein EMIHUDRAFT_454433 [Emiliania huxleyi CCMP1516]EOD39360.1 hypothetical protein EMIHUDRAFT_454433 [Emiliania huxleyi CCMP1516]|eukprot:XP_005791789.1 hypothetical protein EMIHUDRAFT_454433 [Emiliania huxleyi CCMP1516]
MENVTVQQQSYEEGLSFELPAQMMFLAACAMAAFGVCALAAGARVADDIFAMVFAVGTGTVMVGWLAPLLLASEHLEVELVTTWGTTAWWGNRTADPVVHGAEYKFPLDLTCGGALYLTLLVIGLAMLLSRLMLPVALAATGLLSGVTAVRLLANFFPQLLVHAPRQEVLWSCGQQCVVPLSLTVYAPESLLPDGFGAEVYLGYPVQWFWYLAAPFAIAQAGRVLCRGVRDGHGARRSSRGPAQRRLPGGALRRRHRGAVRRLPARRHARGEGEGQGAAPVPLPRAQRQLTGRREARAASWRQGPARRPGYQAPACTA